MKQRKIENDSSLDFMLLMDLKIFNKNVFPSLKNIRLQCLV